MPGAAPKTDIGSFEVNYVDISTRNVYVYWQRIPESMQNGQNFGYYLSVYEDSTLRYACKISSIAASNTDRYNQYAVYIKHILSPVSNTFQLK